MRRRSIFIFIAILSIFAVDPAHLSAAGDAIDNVVLRTMAERHIPGAALAIIRNGRVVKMRGYGKASLEFGVPVTTRTVFEIGSVSKQMTAAGIMLLVEKGKVDLDAPISKYLPGTPAAWGAVTVRNLLTHTSGIKSYTSLEDFELWRRMTVQDFIKKLAPYPLEFTPGEKNIYSNSAFNLLAFIIEAQSGEKYIDYMKENIFLPLGMTHTTDRDPEYIIPNRSNGYEWNEDHLSGRDGSLTDLTGAGSIVSTIEDMTKWEAALHGNKFLSPASRKAIWTQFTFNNGTLSPYGFGWRISEVRGHKLIGHTGQTAGFGSAIFRYVDDGVTVIALTNLGASGMGSQIAVAAVKKVIPSLSLAANTHDISLPKRDIATINGAIGARYGIGDSAANLTNALTQRMASERSENELLRLRKFAPVKKIRVVSKLENAQTVTYKCIVETATKKFLWKITLDENGMVNDIGLDDEEYN